MGLGSFWGSSHSRQHIVERPPRCPEHRAYCSRAQTRSGAGAGGDVPRAPRARGGGQPRGAQRPGRRVGRAEGPDGHSVGDLRGSGRAGAVGGWGPGGSGGWGREGGRGGGVGGGGRGPHEGTKAEQHSVGHRPWLTVAGGGGGWHRAMVLVCLPLAAPIGLSPLHILTLCGSERVVVVSTEPPDDLSCLTTPGVGCPGDGLLPVPLTRCIQMHTPSPCGRLPTPAAWAPPPAPPTHAPTSQNFSSGKKYTAPHCTALPCTAWHCMALQCLGARQTSAVQCSGVWAGGGEESGEGEGEGKVHRQCATPAPPEQTHRPPYGTPPARTFSFQASIGMGWLKNRDLGNPLGRLWAKLG